MLLCSHNWRNKLRRIRWVLLRRLNLVRAIGLKGFLDTVESGKFVHSSRKKSTKIKRIAKYFPTIQCQFDSVVLLKSFGADSTIAVCGCRMFRVKTHLTHSELLFTFAFTCNSNIYRKNTEKVWKTFSPKLGHMSYLCLFSSKTLQNISPGENVVV